jgi:organic radical activating enzyme
MEERLYIHEIFPSFQGEGILVGIPQVFVRFSGCNLGCSYCDTPAARERAGGLAVYGGEGLKEEVPNPVDADAAARMVSSLWSPGMHSVSLTGGEPLLQARGLTRLLPVLKREGMGIYLETNGTLGDALELVLPWTDVIAMDVKLPSTQDGEDLIPVHREFLARVPAGRAFLKMVVGAGSGDGEVEEACRGLSAPARAPVLVLQPATPLPGEEAITARRALELYEIARAFFADVRVIPQAHRAWWAK